jgi:plasmid maintenance system antidote protein VapI
MTGLDLKLKRVAARVKAQDVATSMGITKSRISAIEGLPQVTEATAERYLAALDTLTNVRHVGEVAV